MGGRSQMSEQARCFVSEEALARLGMDRQEQSVRFLNLAAVACVPGSQK